MPLSPPDDVCRDLQSHPSEQTNRFFFISVILADFVGWSMFTSAQQVWGKDKNTHWQQHGSVRCSESLLSCVLSAVSHTQIVLSVRVIWFRGRILTGRHWATSHGPSSSSSYSPHTFFFFSFSPACLSSPLLLLFSVILSFILDSIFSVRLPHFCPSTKVFCRFDSVC